jgi:hypothetical protein
MRTSTVKAVSERDFGWFGALMAKHYAGDDSDVRALAGGILKLADVQRPLHEGGHTFVY